MLKAGVEFHNCTPKHLHEVLTKQSRFVSKTIRESMTTAPEVIKGTAHTPEGAQAEYRVTTNQSRVEQANENLDKNLDEVNGRIYDPHDITDQTIVDGQVLATRLQKAGNFNEAIRVLETLSEKLSRAGQTVQAASIWNRLTPEGALKLAVKVTKKAGKKLDPKAGEEIVEQAKKVQSTRNKRKKDVETAVLMKKIADQVPVSKWKQLGALQTMAQLLNPKTAIRNILGNGLFSAAETGTNVLSAAIDAGLSKITGKRTIVMPQLRQMASGAKRGIKQGIQEATLGVDTQGGKFDLPAGKLFKNRYLNALETALHIELGAADKAFYTMAYRESLLNQVKAAGKSGLPKRITPEMVAIAHEEALYKTFQDKSAAAKIFTGIKKALNLDKDFGLGDFVLKYPKTPANLLSRGFAYSPLGFVNTVYEPVKVLMGKGPFDQRKFVQSFSRAAVGSGGIMATAYTFGKLGLATGKGPGDPDIAAVKKLKGLPPYSINKDGMLRFAMSGMNPEAAKPRPGDTWVSYDWAQPMSSVFAAGVDVSHGGKGPVSTKAQDAVSTALQATIEGADTLSNQGMMQGIRTVTNGRDADGKTSLATGLVDLATGAPASFVPTAIKQVNDAADNTARETYDPNKFNQAVNQVKAKIPGLAQTLPKQANVYGNDRGKYQDGSNNLFNVFLNPAFVSKLKSDPAGDEVLRLYGQTGDTKQSPRLAPKSVQVTQHGQAIKLKLTGQEVADYQRAIGTDSKRLLDHVVQMPQFSRLSDEGKASVMASLVSDANTAAKIRLFQHQPSQRPNYVVQGLLRNSPALVMAGMRKHFISEFRDEIRQRRAAAR